MTELDVLEKRLIQAQRNLDAANEYGNQLERINEKWKPFDGAPFPFGWVMLIGWMFDKWRLDRRTPLRGRDT